MPNPTDALIWIGQSYTGISCGPRDCYRLPYTRHTRCYVHEAGKRGCCRKVPFFPKWAELNRTRIFLAHRDAQTEPSRGVVFGYYVLRGMEGVSPAWSSRSLCVRDVRQRKGEPHTGDLVVRVLRADLGEQIKDAQVTATSDSGAQWQVGFGKNGYFFTNLPLGLFDLLVTAPGYQPETVQGVAVEEKRRRTIDVYLTPLSPPDDDELTRDCWDGSTIVTHVYSDGQWKETGNECPDLPLKPCPDRKEIRQKCWDGSEIVVARCVEGKWVRTREKCPKFPKPDTPPRPDNIPVDVPCPSVDDMVFEEHRDCSLRIKPRSIYLMDALAVEISRRFHADPRLLQFKRQFAGAASDTQRDQAVCLGRHLFNCLVDEVSSAWQPRTEIPPGLKAKAELRGELVYFAQLPVFRRFPKAAFRGLIRINGDRLLEGIRQEVAEIDLDACRQ